MTCPVALQTAACALSLCHFTPALSGEFPKPNFLNRIIFWFIHALFVLDSVVIDLALFWHKQSPAQIIAFTQDRILMRGINDLSVKSIWSGAFSNSSVCLWPERGQQSAPRWARDFSREPIRNNIACIFFLLYQAFIRAAGMSHACPNQTDLISYAHTRAETQANAFQLPEMRETFSCVFNQQTQGSGLSACVVCMYHSINYCYISKLSSIYHLLSTSANS